MLIQRIKLTNLLSFGPDTPELELRPLNVLIGPNGSGKSNLIEALSLLQAAPRDLTRPVIKGGGVESWIWKGEPPASSAHVEVVLDNPAAKLPLRHGFAFTANDYRLRLISERIETAEAYPGHDQPYRYFWLEDGRAILNYRDGGKRQLVQARDLNPERSILAQRRDPEQYPELTWLGDTYPRMRLYREWSFGRNAPPRLPQDTALLNDFLMEGGQNLGLMLNRLKQTPAVKNRFLEALRQLYEGIDDFDVQVVGGTVQVTLQEGNVIFPATRLSDGTLRHLCLLAILCHPTPPPLVCIEEPELGLHPDIIPGLAELLREASQRSQLIVTTHSDVLVDSLTDTPESVVVCEKHHGRTTMKRLVKNDLAHWLEDYRLGRLWSSGEIGGNRW